MKKSRFYVLAAVSGMLLAGCTNELIETPDAKEKEAFAQAFINNFCVPAEGHTFSMVNAGEITIRTSKPTDVMVVGNTGGKRYLFAQCDGATDGQKITFDVPSDIKNVLVLTNETGYPVRVGGTVNLEADPVKSFAKSRDGETTDLNLTGKNIVQITGLSEGYDPIYNVSGELFSGRVPTQNSNAPVDKTVENWGDWWRNDVGPSVPIIQEALKQLLTTGIDPTTFYSAKSSRDENVNRFKKDNFTRNHRGPGLYIAYMRKPEKRDYTFGLMIGDELLLEDSRTIYKMPMLRTKDMDKPVQYAIPDSPDKFDYRGIDLEVHVGYDDKGNVARWYKVDDLAHLHPSYQYGYDFSDRFMQDIRDMADLYEAGVLHKANDEVSMAGDTSSDNPLIPYSEDAKFEYYNNFKTYLYNKCNALKSDATYGTKVHDLHDLKAILTYNGALFDLNGDGSPSTILDYPEVTRLAVEGEIEAYKIRYQMNMHRKFDNDHRMENGDAARGSFFEPTTNNDHTLFLSQGTWANIPQTLQGHQLCYYVEYDDNHQIKTTYAEDLMMTNDIQYSEKGAYHRGYVGTTNYFSWDINDDKIYDDIIFTDASAGGGKNTIYDEYTWLLACEDLGSSSSSDTDYNDVIVSVNYSTSGSNIHISKVKFKALAAGGIYPAYLMVSDGSETGIIGKEIHEWLGGTNTGGELEMINTDADEMDAGDFKAAEITYDYDRQTHGDEPFSLADVTKTQGLSQHYVRFWVLVDRQNEIQNLGLAPNTNGIKWLTSEEYNQIDALPGIFKINNVPVANVANENNVNIPLIICVGSDWEWPKETTNIKNAYPAFTDWMQHPDQYMNKADGENIKKWYGLNGTNFIEGIYRENVVKRQK